MFSPITVENRICPLSAPPSESDSVPLPRGTEARRFGTNHVQSH